MPRHPRWTRHETLVLIQGKRVAEGRGPRSRRSTRSTSGLGKNQVEPKWDFVSSYCRRHGVERWPVQCRKRWSNLVSDFKKIKAWEAHLGQECGGYWTMRSDSRRGMKLPGFFDREVYDVLDGNACMKDSYQLALVTVSEDRNLESEDEDKDEDEGLYEEIRHDSPQVESKRNDIPSPVPISEIRFSPFDHAESSRGSKRRQDRHFRRASECDEGMKRRRQASSDNPDNNVNNLLLKALESNTNMLNAHLEEHKLNREQQIEQHNSLKASLTKITDALEKIVNKL